jgi:rhodanese-related sulfurtransferase
MTELITRTDLEALLATGDVVIVDALPASYYDPLHLPAALNLVESDVDTEAPRLLPDKSAAIVTYCSNEACNNSQAVANRLETPWLHRRSQVPRGHPGLGRGRIPDRVDPGRLTPSLITPS